MSVPYTLAQAIARLTLRGLVDKAGRPAYMHAHRVAQRMKTYGEATVAFLHDVLEDTPTTVQDLVDLGLPADVVRDVETLTRRKDETYGDYILRVALGSPTAVKVKLADIRDHLVPVEGFTLPDSLRTRYEKALKILEQIPG